MLVGGSALTKLRAKKGIAVQKDRYKPEKHAVLFAESIDRLLHHAQIKRGLLFAGRTQGQRLKQKPDHLGESLITNARFPHQFIQRRQWAFDLLAVENHIAIPILGRNLLDVIGKLVRFRFRTIGHETQDLLRHARNLQCLRTVDRIKIGVIPQPMIPDHR